MKKLRLTLILFAVVQILTLASCVMEGPEQLTTEQLIEQIGESMKDVKNYDSKLNFNIKMSTPDTSYNLKILSNSTSYANPLKVKQIMTFEYPGISITNTTYLEESEGSYTAYIQSYDQWYKTSASAEELDVYMQADVEKTMMDYLSEYKSIKDLGSEEIEGIKVRKIELELSGEKFLSLISGNAEILQNLGGFDVKKLPENINDFKAVFWIDEAKYIPVKMETDVSEIINEFIGVNADKIENDDESEIPYLSGVTFDTCVITMEIFNINTAADFTVPDEAYAASNISEDDSEMIG